MLQPESIRELLSNSSQSVDSQTALTGTNHELLPYSELLTQAESFTGQLSPAQQAIDKELQKHAAPTLVHSKVPRRIVLVDEIPKGSTGKLQRVGLAKQLGLDKADAVEAAPSGLAERDDSQVGLFLQELWCQILDLTDNPVFARFIDLGNDSIQATRLVNQIRNQLDINLTLIDFFDAPTIAHQAIIIQEKNHYARSCQHRSFQ